ncbi:hypothetical protein AC579_9080 [Pseudocercospora musae]|uniref:Uncharacterized protein n=1 Tax=Pseudocercospora musae TaxID=113226 RepID=A0A139IFG7_9PEZI|nr:hypothetical protein AC579_9080 [Pseudocercospora musae]
MPYCYDCGAPLQPGDRTLCVQCRARLHADRWLPPFQQSLTPGHVLGCRCVPCLLPALPSGWMAHYEPDIESWSYVNQNTGQRRVTHPALHRATIPPPPPVPAFGSIAPQVDRDRQQSRNTQASKPSTDSAPNFEEKELASKQEPSQSTSITPAVPSEPRAILPPPLEAGPSSLPCKEADHTAAQGHIYPQCSRKRSASLQENPAKRVRAINEAWYPDVFRPRSPFKAAAFAEDTDDDLTDLGDDDEVKFSLPCRRCKGIQSDFRAWGHNYAQCPAHTPAKHRRLQQELEVYRSGLTDDQQPQFKEGEGTEEEAEGLLDPPVQSHVQPTPHAMYDFGPRDPPPQDYPLIPPPVKKDGDQPEQPHIQDTVDWPVSSIATPAPLEQPLTPNTANKPGQSIEECPFPGCRTSKLKNHVNRERVPSTVKDLSLWHSTGKEAAKYRKKHRRMAEKNMLTTKKYYDWSK